MVLVLFIFFVASVVLSAVCLVYSPTVLEAVSAMILKPQPGAIPWNGRDRITVVAMGLTQRTTEPARTDTLLAMDINPATHHINMLSVPRDLWVNVPGSSLSNEKLADAYAIGGAKLAAYTLERDLGIPVDYTVAMTFRGFMHLIDAMGGVDVNVPQELKDPTYPCLVGFDYCPIDIKPGLQHMTGATALEFVRERHAFAQQDLARVKDQQAFSDAVKRTLVSPATWPRYGAVLRALEGNVITNVPLNDFPEMGVQFLLARQNNVNHSYINIQNGMVTPDWSADGQSILRPTNSTVIPNLVHQLFSDPTLVSEHASVSVMNGSTTSGAAADVSSTLQGLGFNTVQTGNADASTYTQSQVIENTAVSGASDYTARRLQRILNATLVKKSLSNQSARIEVIVGSDQP
ncbi:MAG TPA: LCP family protein [Chloroflexota bacterium]|jgi:LCP family protein required for cell wall assembly